MQSNTEREVARVFAGDVLIIGAGCDQRRIAVTIATVKWVTLGETSLGRSYATCRSVGGARKRHIAA